ncbi:MAG: hypothetical protein RL326_1441 [Pseudomonadota bacterium]|jgi:hypothetical protein
MAEQTNPEDASKIQPANDDQVGQPAPEGGSSSPDAPVDQTPDNSTPPKLEGLAYPVSGTSWVITTVGVNESNPELLSTGESSSIDTSGLKNQPARAALYSYSDLLEITDALKFAAKIFTPDRTPGATPQPHVRPNVPVPLLESAVDIALQLIVAGAPTKFVVAGILNDVFSGFVDAKRTDLNTTIDRKFGDLDDSGKISGLIGRVSKTDSPKPDVWLQRKAKIVNSLLAEIPDPDRLASPYTQQDLVYMTKAMRYVHNVFVGAKPRPWGPDETLPMFHHASQVGLLLVGSGQPKEVVVAGLMHDFYEGYVNKPTRDELENHVKTHFGSRVHELIAAITEPPKGPELGNWRERKLSVVNSLMSAGQDANTIVCASKISTMAEGNKFLYRTGTVCGWSAGSWEDNLQVFRQLRDIFAANQVPWPLIHRYDVELKRWGKHGSDEAASM